MQKTAPRNWRPADVLISFIVLGFLIGYTYGLLFKAPYPGFYFNTTDGTILQIYKRESPVADLRVNDVIERIGSSAWADYYQNRNLNVFGKVQPGQVIEIMVRRDGKSIIIPWVYTGFNLAEFQDRFFNIWWLAYAFWFFGMSTQLFVRPKDAQWRLLVAANYLTGIFIILGSLSSFHIWGSSTLLRVITWLILPVYIHFHWIFPAPLLRIPDWTRFVLYAVCLGTAAAELFLPTSRILYFFALILALGGSTFLLGFHFLFQPHHRREVRLLAIISLFALIPAMAVSLAGTSGQMPQSAPLSLLALLFLPAAYFYAVYQRRLGGLEVRANRAISIYIFLTVLGTALLLGVGYSGLVKVSQETLAFASVLIALLAAFISIVFFPSFQALIERRFLGIRLLAQNMVAEFSARIITSTTLARLVKLLEEEVFPSLLVRQYAFIRSSNSSAKILLSKNVTDDQVREEAVMRLITSSEAGHLFPLPEQDQSLAWVRLILPLRVGSDIIGAWLLGRRDPDDLYPQAELPILQSLANQTAIALSNILQTERLRKMYEDDIERNEKSRHQLALDLHDSVLNQLAILRLSVDDTHVSQNFQGAYDEVATRLREIVTELRPPMLSYGLKPAIEELADNLMDRSKDMVNVVTDIRAEGEVRYSENIEQHLFRIVQESCENALRHSRATQIKISARLMSDRIQLSIEDNGIGLEAGGSIELDDLLANKHFGLAGMLERAILIGAEVNIGSSPQAGTQISIALDAAQHKAVDDAP